MPGNAKADSLVNDARGLTTLLDSELDSRQFVRDLHLYLRKCRKKTFSKRVPYPLRNRKRLQAALLLRVGTQSALTGHWLGRCAGVENNTCGQCGEVEIWRFTFWPHFQNTPQREPFTDHILGVFTNPKMESTDIFILLFQKGGGGGQRRQMQHRLLHFLEDAGLTNSW